LQTTLRFVIDSAHIT